MPGQRQRVDHPALVQGRQFEARQFDHRQKGVAEGMPQHDVPFRQTLGPGGADEILADHIEHRAAHVAAPDRDFDQRQHDRGCHEVAGIVAERAVADGRAASGRQPGELHGKAIDDDEPEPERGDRERHHGADGGERVEDGAAPHGPQHAHHDSEQHGHEDGRRHQLKRRGQAPGDDREDRLVVPVGMAPVARQQTPDPFPVLQRQRTIETHLVRDMGQLILRHAGDQRELRQRTARRQVKNGEPDGRDQSQQDQALDRAVEQERGQRILLDSPFVAPT